MENSQAVSQTIKHKTTILPSNTTPRYIPNKSENMFMQKLVYECLQ